MNGSEAGQEIGKIVTSLHFPEWECPGDQEIRDQGDIFIAEARYRKFDLISLG